LDRFFWETTLKSLNLESPGRDEAVKAAKQKTEEKKKIKEKIRKNK
jgi:hypothetical protein